MKLFGLASTPVSATAVASDIITSNGCVYVENPGLAANPAVYMSGNSLIAAQKCGVSINGNLNFNGNKATIDAGFVAVTGTISNSNIIPRPPYAEDVPPQANPLAFLNNAAPSKFNAVLISGGMCTIA